MRHRNLDIIVLSILLICIIICSTAITIGIYDSLTPKNTVSNVTQECEYIKYLDDDKTVPTTSVIAIPTDSVSNVKYDGATLSWDDKKNKWEAVSADSHWTTMNSTIGIEKITVGKTELKDGPNGEFLIKGNVIVDGTITQKGKEMTIVAGGLSWMTWFTIIFVVVLTVKFVNNFNWRIILWPIKKLFSFFKKEAKEVEKTWNSIEGD